MAVPGSGIPSTYTTRLMRDASRLDGIPGVLAHGRCGLSSPLDVPWQLHGLGPDGELVAVDDGNHSSGRGMYEALRAATDRVATGLDAQARG